MKNYAVQEGFFQSVTNGNAEYSHGKAVFCRIYFVFKTLVLTFLTRSALKDLSSPK